MAYLSVLGVLCLGREPSRTAVNAWWEKPRDKYAVAGTPGVSHPDEPRLEVRGDREGRGRRNLVRIDRCDMLVSEAAWAVYFNQRTKTYASCNCH